MEIPKNLQQEIIAVQHKLINAIREHQVCMVKLKDDPNNPSIRDQMHEIQLHIISLGRCQKQVLQRLRKEVQAFKADNTNGSKVSVTSLLGLNNNNHITNNNETKHETAANCFETKPSKDHYEEVITNGDVPSPAQHNDCAKRGPSSVETISGEDDIVEVPMDKNSNEKQEKTQKQQKSESEELEDFLYYFGLTTKSKATELQNKRAERKRRSTANPQFVYSLLEQPIKRQKRYSYLQSGNAPHTRQTTARMNGPSPPLNKARTTKSTSPPVRTVTKSLIPVQKSTTRPNILRNADSKVFVNKNKIEDNTRSSLSSAKSVQSINSKTVHIPGLPSSLTIERIENDSLVCICCRNPGTLTVCENCSSNYHVTCHTRSPALSRICPKCALMMDEEKDVQKNEEAENNERMEGENKRPRLKKSKRLATTTIAPGAIGKTREDSEIYKTSGGLHKVDAIEEKRILSASYGIGQLPLSTFLIPITSNNTSNVDQSEDSQFSSVDTIEQQHDVIPRNPVVLNQHQRSGITYIQAEDQMPYSYQLPSTSLQHEKHQSYLIVKKITEPIRRIDQLISGQSDNQSRSAVLNYQLPTTSNCNSSLEAGIVVAHSLLFGRNNRKKQASPRAVPGLRRIIGTERLLPVTGDYQLDRATLNGRKPWAKLSRGKLCINQQSVSRPATEILLSSYGDESNDEQLQIARSTVGPTEEGANLNGRGGKHRSTRSGHAIIHSLLSGNNRSHIITDRAREQSRCFSPNDRDCPLLRQQLCRPEHEQQLDPREQPDKPATVQLQRRALTRFFEHVKLEEAHISAPFGTKLVHKNEVALERGELRISENSAREGARDQRYNDGAVGIEAPLSSSNSDEDSPEDSRMQREGWITSNIEVPRNSRDNNAANWSPPRPSSVSPIPPSDCELTRVDAQSPALFRSITPENERSADAFQSDDTYLTKGQTDDATLYTAQNNLSSELRNEVSVPDDKADTERQDLPSGGRRSSFSSNTSSSSGHSDTPEQAMNDANSLSVSHISGGMYELLNIDPISPEGREELARYVSAMREDDRSDTATG